MNMLRPEGGLGGAEVQATRYRAVLDLQSADQTSDAGGVEVEESSGT
jgi:hypothetical protein